MRATLDPYQVAGMVAAVLGALGVVALGSDEPGVAAVYVATAALGLALVAWREARK